MAESRQDDLIGLVVEGYEVVRPVGAGGMGVVYEARHKVLGRRAAVKVLHGAAALDADASKRFLLEAQAVNAVRHRGLVDVFGFGTLPNGSVYLVMEYLEGRTLEELEEVVAEEAPLPVGQALSLTAEVLDAVAAAHARGIVHRDLKPSNVFWVQPTGARPYVKVLDFGLAKLMDTAGFVSVHTRTAIVVGTPYYMSPEQACAEPVSPASDLYSVGLILFELLTGRRAFEAANPALVMRMHVYEPAPFAADANPRVPEDVDDLLHWLLAKAAQRRPPSAAFVAERLRELAKARAGDGEDTGAAPHRALATPALPVLELEEALAPTLRRGSGPDLARTPKGGGAPFGPEALEAARKRSSDACRRAMAASGHLAREADARERKPEYPRQRRGEPRAQRSRRALAVAAIGGGVITAAVLAITGWGRRFDGGPKLAQGESDAGRRTLTERDARQRLVDLAIADLEGSDAGRRGGAVDVYERRSAEGELCIDELWEGESPGGVVSLTGVADAPGRVAAVELSVTVKNRPRVCGSIPVAAASRLALGEVRPRCRGRRGTVFAVSIDPSRRPSGSGKLRLSLQLVDAKGRAGRREPLRLVLDTPRRSPVDAGQPNLTDAIPVIQSGQVYVARVRRGAESYVLSVRWSDSARDFLTTHFSTDAVDEPLSAIDDAARDALLSEVCDGLLMRADPETVQATVHGDSGSPLSITLSRGVSASSGLVISGTTLVRGQVSAATASVGLAAALGRWRGDAGFEAGPCVGQVPAPRRWRRPVRLRLRRPARRRDRLFGRRRPLAPRARLTGASR